MDRQRTFGIVAHVDAGKTTLTERILHDSGAQGHVGSVDDGTAATDWMRQERCRGISITAAATRVEWGGATLQVVDTPGHVDFVAEVERCLCVLDGVVVVVDGVRGVESQTEAIWQQVSAAGLGRLVFVNKLDRQGADFGAVVAQLGSIFGCRAVPLVVPLGDECLGFAGLGDALTGAVQWFGEPPGRELGERLQRQVQAARDRLVEAIADGDEEVLAAVVAGATVPLHRLREGLRAAVVAGRLVPVLAGAALWNRGVDWLLDAVVALLPGPRELPRELARAGLWSADRAGDPDAPFCGLVFKVQHVDRAWNFVRVVRGRFVPGQRCGRSRSAAADFAVPELWSMQADRHRNVELALPGEIVVVPGEFGLRTGETLFAAGAPIALPQPHFPDPVLAATFEPAVAADGPRLFAALRELAVDDPTLRVERDRGQVTVHGMGELHLDIVADLVRERLPVAFTRSRVRVDRRETVLAAAAGEAEVRASVGAGELAARCRVAVAPLGDVQARPAVVVLVPESPAAAVAAQELEAAVAAGHAWPMVGVRVVLEALEAELARGADGLVQQAAKKALDLAVAAAGRAELEPLVAFEIWCPEDSSAPVLADLGARGAAVTGVAAGQLGARVLGRAPLQRLLGYVTRLRSITRGRGRVVLRPLGLCRAE